MRIRFDSGPQGDAAAFDDAQRVIKACTIEDVGTAFADMERAQADGYWIAGYASYELGYALNPKLRGLMPQDRRVPLMCFGVYDAPRDADPLPQAAGDIGPHRPRWDEAEYKKRFDQVNAYIGAGDVYQVNLTLPVDLDILGASDAVYAGLVRRQQVTYGALIEQKDGTDILCRSPELFFRTDATGRIETRPMKGTQPRSSDPIEDLRRAAFLQADEKNRAENLMIVDLLRNDLSRISQIGTVRVPELFKVETYATVHQMTSLIQAQLLPDVGLIEIFAALFPCGSITGAPKLRAMEIIRELEPHARDLYCGSIGWIAPDGASCFNVAIRTLLRDGERAVLNVGGGVVWDSTAASEYEETLWKARFAQSGRM